jgi:hypothetical protein
MYHFLDLARPRMAVSIAVQVNICLLGVSTLRKDNFPCNTHCSWDVD